MLYKYLKIYNNYNLTQKIGKKNFEYHMDVGNRWCKFHGERGLEPFPFLVHLHGGREAAAERVFRYRPGLHKL